MIAATTCAMILLGILLFCSTLAQEMPGRRTNLQPKRALRSTTSTTRSSKAGKKARPLEDFVQWREETGYWLGDFTFYQADGTVFERDGFNYPFDAYKGFITGNIKDFSYRQRNVFVYPPQEQEKCEEDDSVVGVGECGINGNSRIFFADQTAQTDDTDGTVSGPFAPGIFTRTTLVGDDNALLYQVFAGDSLIQSQLTTITNVTTNTTESVWRTRSAQSFFDGLPRSLSFFRERRVEKEEFYQALKDTLVAFNVLDSDACTTNGFGGGPTGFAGGFDDCMTHLESSFEL